MSKSLPKQSLIERYYQTTQDAEEALLQTICDAVLHRLQTESRAGLIFPGGRSPRRLFTRLCQLNLPWSKIWVTLSDERLVAPDDLQSNGKQVRELLLQEKAASAHFVPFVSKPFVEAIDQVEKRLVEFPWPADVVMLGMGDDAHTASLFPGQFPEMSTASNLVMEATAPSEPRNRISLTPKFLLNAERIILWVNTPTKLARYQEAKTNSNADKLPISFLFDQSETIVEAYLISSGNS